MNVDTYLKRYGTPPMEITWGFRELAQDTDAPEPAILISCLTNLEGYEDYILSTLENNPQIGLTWNKFRQGWTIDPVLDNQIVTPPIVICYYNDHGWLAALERDRSCKIKTLWNCGCPIILRIQYKRSGRFGSGILFDKFALYEPLEPQITDTILNQLDLLGQPFEALQYWASAGDGS